MDGDGRRAIVGVMDSRLVAVLLVLTAGCAGLGHAPQISSSSDAPQESAAARNTLVVMLGTGTPNPDPERSGPAVAIIAGGKPYLVDCGPGVVRRAEAAFLTGVSALDMPNLTRLFVTHLHSDHTAGYADLILTPWVLEREEPLEVYGPPGICSMTDHILAAYAEDIDVRIHGSQPQNESGIQVNAHEIEAGEIYRDENVTVTAFPVVHGDWAHAFGYRFDTTDRAIVISGDTVATDAVVDACSGCDVLVHEVYAAAQHYGDFLGVVYDDPDLQASERRIQMRDGAVSLYQSEASANPPAEARSRFLQ